MPSVNYSLNLRTKKSNGELGIMPKRMSLGESVKTVEPIASLGNEIVSERMTNGWINNPDSELSSSRLSFNRENFIIDGSLLSPDLNGISVSLDKEIRVDSSTFVRAVGNVPCMGTTSRGLGSNSKVFIFKRKDNKVSVYKEYNYINSSLTNRKINDNEFTEIDVDGVSYICTSLNNPIPLSRLKGSNIDIGINDYLAMSYDYDFDIANYGISEENFIESFDYISVEDMNMRPWDVTNNNVTLRAQYFPIYPHVTILANMEDGIYQVGINFARGVDGNRGEITVDGSFVSKIGMGDCLGFYVFYGVVPSVHFLEDSRSSMDISSFLGKERSIDYIGFDNEEYNSQPSVSETYVPISRDVTYQSCFTDIFMPKKYEEFFVEPNAPLQINGITVGPGLDSERLFFANNGTNRIELAAAEHIFDLMQPIDFSDEDTVKIDSNLSGTAIAIYGLFHNEGYNRVSMMSVVSTSGDGQNEVDKNMEAVGYGEGPYSAGGYSQGRLGTYNSLVTWNIPNTNPFTDYNQKMAVQVNPNELGYEIVLPAWTLGKDIQVHEVGTRSSNLFLDWRFVGPDVVILDKNKVDLNKIYNITFKSYASPIIPHVDLLDNEVDVIINRPPRNLYSSFRDLFLLGNRAITLRIGYINSLGARSYLSTKVDVEVIMTHNYIQQVVTGLKSIIF